MNTFNYIVKRLPSDAILQSLSNASVFSLEITSIEQLLNFDFKNIHNSRIFTNKFCSISLYINLSSFTNTGTTALLKDTLQQLFFHSSYLKPNNQPLIFITANLENDSDFQLFLTELNSFSISNGFENTVYIYLQETANNATQCLYTFKDESEFEKTYQQLISNSFFCANYFSIINVSEDLLLKIDAKVTSVESRMEKEDALKYSLLKRAFHDAQKISKLEDTLKYVKEDLNNNKTYLDIFKSQDESKKIKNFYANEYEVLPLWYKQFGHILKVISGKRTFKSLFNNNYKNK